MAEALDPILPAKVDALVEQVLREACLRGLTLGAAESCTGGLLASLLTDVPGASHAFERGFVVYSNEAKHELLGVPAEILEGPGAVSRECAVALAEGALRASRADVVASITGWAEAGPEPGQPAGLVHFGCVRRGRPAWHREAQFGDVGRARVRIACLETGLNMMLQALGCAPQVAAG